MTQDICIAGGGFGGFYAARTLGRLLPACGPRAARITLVSDVDYMLFMPPLPGVVGARLEFDHVVVALREALGRLGNGEDRRHTAVLSCQAISTHESQTLRVGLTVRAAKRGGVETPHRDAEKKTGYISRSNPRRSAPVEQISIEGIGRGGKR